MLAHWTGNFPEDGRAVSTFSADGGPVRCAKGLTVEADHSFADAPAWDVLVHPGGRGTLPMPEDEAQPDRPAELDPSVDVRGEQRFVDDGDVITAAGVSAGIDTALHLVGRLASFERAAEVRAGIQYDPRPPV
ncbi:transcriptional regulator GlxA family with amidase domain [Actinopolyspora biskrensis]|uniref:Transcriptional regulator GlxA family with amidase domain n=1 Tax=Actinopolyspora biskrensis TaxID=1470178 RepID=A0A852ZDS2_9ACTN|nr:transcriptional regulator GlxA family with amidase domain [Actinopolyspora biskrensis]